LLKNVNFLPPPTFLTHDATDQINTDSAGVAVAVAVEEAVAVVVVVLAV